MGRKEQVKRSAEQKWEILQEGLKSRNFAVNKLRTDSSRLPSKFTSS